MSACHTTPFRRRPVLTSFFDVLIHSNDRDDNDNHSFDPLQLITLRMCVWTILHQPFMNADPGLSLSLSTPVRDERINAKVDQWNSDLIVFPSHSVSDTPADSQTDNIMAGGREHQLILVLPSPSPISETARPAGFDRSACGLAPSVSTQFIGVA